MKKAFLYVLISVIVCFSFVGCKSSPVGTYYVDSIDGQPIREYLISEFCRGNASELDNLLSEWGISKSNPGELIQLELNKDGTLKSINRRYGRTNEDSGTWEESNDRIKIYDGASFANATLDGKTLTLLTDGIKFVFKKK